MEKNPIKYIFIRKYDSVKKSAIKKNTILIRHEQQQIKALLIFSMMFIIE